ncbi:hypothetical protein [Providencia sp. Me31A]|uniref:hypothetical protein n=1 Tax=Providencia sp. Me31A TaxID=3392637 RepID=UPI003D2B4AD3
MKRLNIVSLLLTSIISITAWANSGNESISSTKITAKHITSDLDSAPFGFKWGDDINLVKGKLSGQYEIIEALDTCPFTIVKANNLDEVIKGTGEYELLIMPKYEGVTFSGLIAISYKSKPANVREYYSLLNKITNSLSKEYGVLQRARSIDTMERYYFFEGENLTINLTADQYKDYFSIDLEYAFTGDRKDLETEQGYSRYYLSYSTAEEICKKQRSQH